MTGWVDAMGKGENEGKTDKAGAAPCPPGGMPATTEASSGCTHQKLADNIFMMPGSTSVSAIANPIAASQSRYERFIPMEVIIDPFDA